MNLPWIEKYRPNDLAEIISHSDISKTLSRFIDNGRLPHLLLYGPPGTGKTTTILAVAKKLYSARELNSMVLELNASDDRGIDVVRNQILSFASTKTLFAGTFKLMILDEADSMTKDAQNALRRKNTRFCLICNYISKLIPAIQSRCTRIRFAPVNLAEMSPRLKEIANNEGVSLSEDGIKAIYRFVRGDMRKAINLLQTTYMSSGVVNEASVYSCVAYPSPKEIRFIFDSLMNENIFSAFEAILTTKSSKGIALQDILTEVHLLLMRVQLPDSVRCDLLATMADIEQRMSIGASERLQTSALICAFSRTKMCLEPKTGSTKAC